MQRVVKTYTRISTAHGAKNVSKFNRHLGVDYATPEGTTIYAPVNGVIVQSYLSALVGNTYEIKEDGSGMLWRTAHMKTRPLGVGTRVSEGEAIAVSGGKKGEKYSGTSSSGPHVHADVRKAGTAWDASFDNYYDPEALLTLHKAVTTALGRIIHLDKGTTSTVFRRDNGQKAGTIYAKDDTFNYQDRGQDPKFPNRRYIYSASAGGDVSIAMTYTDGKPIEGRRYK